MNIGDRYHPNPESADVVVVRYIHDNGMILVEDDTPGAAVYPYLVEPDTLIPTTK